MNFYELLFNRGQPSGEGMTHFERLFAAKLVGGGEIKELEGVPPLLFKANGEPLIDWSIYGNTVQSGTPTPENPIQPSECGERTAQLFEDKIASCSIDANGSLIVNPSFDMYIAKVEQGVTYTASASITGGFYTTKPTIGSTSYNGQRMAFASSTVTAPITGYMTFRVNSGSNEPMFNEGSTALSYEPYGYKIPISSANTTTPVYLGEVESTRKIKKLVLTGEEDNWGEYARADSSKVPFLPLSDFKGASTTTAYAGIICTHYDTKAQVNIQNLTSKTGIAGRTSIGIIIADESISTLADFKSFLAAQYTNGTPVTVWYVLATETTGIVNEPLMKIGDYADSLTATQVGVEVPTIKGNNTLDIDTTVKPSNVYIKYKT